jgi:hypothetical protein
VVRLLKPDIVMTTPSIATTTADSSGRRSFV